MIYYWTKYLPIHTISSYVETYFCSFNFSLRRLSSWLRLRLFCRQAASACVVARVPASSSSRAHSSARRTDCFDRNSAAASWAGKHLSLGFVFPSSVGVNPYPYAHIRTVRTPSATPRGTASRFTRLRVKATKASVVLAKRRSDYVSDGRWQTLCTYPQCMHRASVALTLSTEQSVSNVRAGSAPCEHSSPL